MRFVLDASVTMTWFLNEEGPSVGALVDRLLDGGAVVPALWALEVANVFQSAIRRNRCTVAIRDAAFADLQLLPIITDDAGRDLVWSEVVGLSSKHGLTVYDAIYLELARRYGVPLATLDAELATAARAEGLTVLP